eukprot:scaffold2844_cov326-Pavlova_lutheri.AAC.19
MYVRQPTPCRKCRLNSGVVGCDALALQACPMVLRTRWQGRPSSFSSALADEEIVAKMDGQGVK